MQEIFSTQFGKLMVQLTRKQWMKIRCYLFHVIFLCISLHSVRYGRGNAPNLLLVRLLHSNYILKKLHFWSYFLSIEYFHLHFPCLLLCMLLNLALKDQSYHACYVACFLPD